MSEQRPLVRGKLAPPRSPGTHQPRPRLSKHFARLLSGHRLVLTIATAGSGKTTAVVDAIGTSGTTTAWLGLDRADVSPGRLLSYLEGALQHADATIPSLVSDVLADGVSHTEAAGLMAESIGDREMLIVIDELEKVADSAGSLETISSFLRYLPPRAKAILISRQDVALDLARLQIAGEVAQVGEGDLALTVDEAEVLLSARESDGVDAASIVQATAGWMTGVLFDSWRSSRHVPGTGGEVDPLRTYLSSEIMASLPSEAQDFLVLTSVLDEVTASRASALGISNPAATLTMLRDMHLPIDFPEVGVMRCHPRLRDYLLEQLEGREPGVVHAIHGAHADLLMEEGRDEDAVEEYLRAGDVAQAEDAASSVMLSIVHRLDVDLAARWLASFRRRRIESSIVMTEVELLVALDREQYGDGAVCADRLLHLLGTEPDTTVDEGVHAAMAWCYFLTGRIDDAIAVLATAPPSPQTEVMSFAIGVELIDSPTHYADRPDDSDTEVDGMLARIDLAHGRFERVLGARATRFDAVGDAGLGALTALGRLEDAQAHLLTLGSGNGWTRVRMRAELLAELGRPEEAWAVIINDRDLLNKTGSVLYRMFAALAEVMLALRFSKDTALATAILDSVEREPTALRRVRVLEQLAMWRGLIALLDGDDVAAQRHLREAVALMTEWDRLLFLPTAAVYLAEAEWRLHEDEASDAAADLALEAADRTGSRHALIRVLREYPAVLSRRLDAETDPDSAWHDLGRAVINKVEQPHMLESVHVSEFGKPSILVDGRRHTLKLAKSVELLAFLALRGGSAAREDVIANLFDSKNDKAASAYLRMAISRVRECIPDHECLTTDAERISWVYGDLESDYTQMRTRLVRLRNVQGAQRLALAMQALAGMPTGDYMPGSRSRWTDDQRRRWTDLDLDIRHAAAEAAFEIADYATAHELIGSVVDRDPFRERAWRLTMRIAAAVGDGDGVIAAFRACEQALSGIGVSPTESTRQLLHRLRF